MYVLVSADLKERAAAIIRIRFVGLCVSKLNLQQGLKIANN